MTTDYPRLLTTAIGIWPVNTFRGVLYRVEFTDGSYATYTELARCRHHHRDKRKASECAERLATADGAPSV